MNIECSCQCLRNDEDHNFHHHHQHKVVYMPVRLVCCVKVHSGTKRGKMYENRIKIMIANSSTTIAF